MDASAITSSKMQTDYMKLLVTQLQNQNPLEPMDNSDMASQLAQFSQLSQMESMNSNFAKVLDMTQRNYATSLIGRDVAFTALTESGDTVILGGKVDQVATDIDGQIILVSGNRAFSLNDIITVKNP